MKPFSLLISCFCASMLSLPMQAQTAVTAAEMAQLSRNKSHSRVSVHDPSIVDTGTGSYYIFGSHNAIARTTDLMNWSGVNNSGLFGVVNSSGKVVTASFEDAFVTNQTKKVTVLKNGVETEVTFGNFDAKAWMTAHGTTVAGMMWAPDVIWNKDMKKWCQYLSLNGDYWSSVIVLLTADNIEGPYVYQGPVTYSGFYNGTDASINWKKTDLELVIGTQSSLPARYNRDRRWGDYWPNNIDPCVLYDEEGQLWMSYGSWSGGIWLIKLNNKNGLRDYTTTYSYKADGNDRATSDPYYGIRIAGGYYSSGEGSYIQHIGKHYYLFMTNGGLSAKEGYVMRSFRSEKIEGPYVDAKGQTAIYNRYEMNYGTNDASMRGNLLMSAFNGLAFQTVAEVAQGHNSAFVDSKGRSFLIYHTRFNTGNEGFQNRVHQMFLNQHGWLCVAPFEFDGETLTDDSIAAGCKYSKDEIPGDYQFVLHKYKLNNEQFECADVVNVTLNENGTISGDRTGAWSLIEGTGYANVKIGGVTYFGVICQQTVDGRNYRAIAFTGLATTGVTAWGWKMEPQSAITYTVKNATAHVKSGAANTHLDFNYTNYYGTTDSWISSEPTVISNEGKYNPADTVTTLTLTHHIASCNYYYDETYNIRAQAATQVEGDYATGLLAYYEFDETPVCNYLNAEDRAMLARQSSGVSPVLNKDIARFGQVLKVTGGTEAAKSGGLARMNNPLFGLTDLEGMSISFWVKRNDADRWGTIFSFVNSNPAYTTTQNNLSFTGNTYLGFTNGVDTFAINYPTTERNTLEVGEWKFVTITIDKAEGVKIYINKTKRVVSFASTEGTRAANFDYQKVLDFLTASQYLSIGKGNGYGTADMSVDELFVHQRALTAEDVEALYAAETRVTDIKAAIDVTGVEDIAVDTVNPKTDDAWYTLQGLKLADKPTGKGVYIWRGRKYSLK